MRPAIMPARVVSRNGWIVTVEIMVETEKNIPEIVDVPVLLPRYVYAPLQPGDAGILIPSDFYLDRVVDSGVKVSPDDKPHNLSAYAFMPLPRSFWQPSAGAESTAIYSPSAINYLAVSDSGAEVKTPLHAVEFDNLFNYLNLMQTAFSTQLKALGQAGFDGTFE